MLSPPKLLLHKEPLRRLSEDHLIQIEGGASPRLDGLIFLKPTGIYTLYPPCKNSIRCDPGPVPW